MKKLFSTISLMLFAAFMMNAQTVNVTFQVDMSVQAAKGAFDPAADQVEVRGSFNGWDFGDQHFLTDDNGDSVYVGTITSDANTTINYKFYYSANETWESFADNRAFDVADADVTVPVALFNDEPMPSGDPAPVTFNVDMRLPARAGDFDPSTRSVFVAGSFTDWGTNPVMLEDTDGDSTYTVTTDINSAQIAQYKFIYANTPDTSDIQWESVENRTAWISDDATQTFTSFWNDVDPDANLKDGNIEFTVDMSVMTEVGIFDAAVDSLRIRGGFNGWGDNDRDKAIMSQNFLSPNLWFLQVPFVQTEVGASQLYKFFVAKSDAATTWVDGYERPLLQGGGNRPVDFEGTDNQEVPAAYYDDVLPNYMIPAGTNVSITFSVDMTNAADAAVQALPFDAATDTVYWIAEQPAFVESQGWTDTDEMRVLVMTDPDNDMVYTGTLNITAPSWNGFEYRYAYSSPTNGFIAEPSGYGTYAYRVRYMEQDGYQSFVQPYDAPQDSWIAQEDKSAEWENGPTGVTAVGDNEITPLKFQLSQNYPNPFNPSTAIKFTIAKAGNVTLKVFNVLGQQVSTLINKEMTAGNYDFNFNASSLSSGIYFYTLRTGNNVATKKMVLLK